MRTPPIICTLCKKPIRKNQRPHEHHPKPQSEGGTRTVTVHDSCHRKHHSANSDFARWGRIGGKRTAIRGYWRRNLKRGTQRPDPNAPLTDDGIPF